MYRRDVLTTVGSAISGLTALDSGQPLSERTLSVRIDWTPALARHWDEYYDGSGFRADLDADEQTHPALVALAYLEYNVMALAHTQSDHYAVDYDYRVEVGSIVDLAETTPDDGGTTYAEAHETTFDAYDAYIADDETSATDANILLTHGANDAGYTGRAACQSCQFESRPPADSLDERRANSDACMISHAEQLARFDPQFGFTLPWWRQGVPILQAVIHEVGHCFGLSHDVADVYTVADDRFSRDARVVTPMLGAYYTNDAYDITLACTDKPEYDPLAPLYAQMAFGQYATRYPINITDADPICRQTHD